MCDFNLGSDKKVDVVNYVTIQGQDQSHKT